MNQDPELSFRLGDLQECNNEKIHLSGAVQGHGGILFYTPDDQRIQAASANLTAILRLSQKSITGQKISHILESHFVDELLKLQKTYPWKTPGQFTKYVSMQGAYDVYFYHTQGLFAIEFEPLTAGDEKREADFAMETVLQEFMEEVKDTTKLEDLSNIVCRYIRHVTGIDRVMMYKFMPPSWHGEVIGEDRVLSAHSYLHHRFPSADIPKPARDLYLRNKVRLIVSSEGAISPIEPAYNPLTRERWDLSDSRLRSVSPIHLEYLKNMGVNGSMSFAVIVKGQLWGLIACHHLGEFYLSQEKRAVCCAIADVMAAQAPMIEMVEGLLAKSTFESRLRKVLEGTLLSKNILQGLMKQHELLMEAFNATGAAIANAQHVDLVGITPPLAALKPLASKLLQEMRSSGRAVLALRDLRQVQPDWDDNLNFACGALCVDIGDKADSLLIFFRPEFIKYVVWGGDPVKNLEKKGFAGQINPRTSFSSWQETIRHQSLPWATYETDGILFLKDVLFDSLLMKENIIQDMAEGMRQLKGNK